MTIPDSYVQQDRCTAVGSSPPGMVRKAGIKPRKATVAVL